jgi:hypothetical protein
VKNIEEPSLRAVKNPGLEIKLGKSLERLRNDGVGAL